MMKNFINGEPEIFNNKTDRVSYDQISQNPVKSSLTLVKPETLNWHVTTDIRNRPQARAKFDLKGVPYNLGITDPEWKCRLCSMPPGDYSREETGIDINDDINLTISLGEPLDGFCYKLIAAVIILPRSS